MKHKTHLDNNQTIIYNDMKQSIFEGRKSLIVGIMRADRSKTWRMEAICSGLSEEMTYYWFLQKEIKMEYVTSRLISRIIRHLAKLLIYS